MQNTVMEMKDDSLVMKLLFSVIETMMAKKFVKHPKHPDRVRPVSSKDYDKWLKAGWKPAKESEAPETEGPQQVPSEAKK